MKLSEDLNPKCERISKETYKSLIKVSGGAEALSWDMHLLANKLAEDHADGYEGLVWFQSMAARVNAISNEIADVIDRLEIQNKMPE